MWTSRLLSFLTFFVLARLLRPSDFGLVALASAFTSIVGVLAEAGLSAAIIQRREVSDSQLSAAFWFGVGSSVLLAGTISVLAPLAAGAFDEPSLTAILVVLSITLPIAALGSVHQATLTRNLDFRSLAVRGIAASVAGGGSAVAMAIGGLGVWSLVGQQVTTTIVSVALLWRLVPWRPKPRVQGSELKELLRYSLNVLGINVLNVASRRVDDLLIGAVLGTRALGIYAVAYRLILLLLELVGSVITSVAFPAFSRIASDHARVRVAWREGVRFLGMLAPPVFVGIAAVAPVFVPLVYGEQWRDAVPVMIVLSGVGLIQALSYFNPEILKAVGRPGRLLALNAFGTTLTVAFMVAAVQRGITAVAVAYLAATLIRAPLTLTLATRTLGASARVLLTPLVKPLTAAAAMGGVVVLIMRALPDAVTGIALLAVLVLSGAAAYFAGMLLIARTELRESWARIAGS